MRRGRMYVLYAKGGKTKFYERTLRQICLLIFNTFAAEKVTIQMCEYKSVENIKIKILHTGL